MIKTEFFNDFIVYYDKAQTLQNVNIGLYNKFTKAEDPIMNSVTIYDVINRRFAGFSKVLEDIHGQRKTGLIRYPSYKDKLDSFQFHLLHLFHRFTGSGASFQPTILLDGSRNPKEHGYCNNHVYVLAQIMVEANTATAIQYIAKCSKPMVTSTGNQPPSLKNHIPEKYRLAMQYYFDNHAIEFVSDYINFVSFSSYTNQHIIGIKEAVDFCCKWHKDRGFKQWHFVLTAFVMDTAEYYSELVDPKSHCYYGANCVKAFNLMFQKEPSDGKINKARWNEMCMTELVKARPVSLPYDMEDCCCDVIRYWTEYIPKGYDHLKPEQRVNNSTLKVDGGYKEEAKKRIKEVLGKDY